MTIWFENLATGQQWAVSNADLIARLREDSAYKIIADPATPQVQPVPKRNRKKAEASSAE